ncbi:MAG: glycosyltransferase family 39 protein [Deltaproteobacteria bacterium]|nr:glycosyltransferase family 39 protein [Deltaproteobacteria bacterium]MCL5277568.1 glycosyltransferase family 39 protein [Deltaproteobacteria bacterium]
MRPTGQRTKKGDSGTGYKSARTLLLRIVPYVIVAVLSYSYLHLYKYYLPSPTEDEGMFPYRAYQILNGKVLYKDIGAILFPGNYYFLAFIYKMFGYSFAVTRELVLSIDVVSSLLIYRLSSIIIKRWFAVLPPLLFLVYGFPAVFGYSHYVNSMTMLFVALIFLYTYLEGRSTLSLCCSGVFVGLTTLFLQSKGVIAFAVFVFVLFMDDKGRYRGSRGTDGTGGGGTAEEGQGRDRDPQKAAPLSGLRATGYFAISAAAVVAVAFSYIAVKGALLDFVQNELVAARIYKGLTSFSLDMLSKGFISIWTKESLIRVLWFGGSGILGLYLLLFKKESTPEQAILFAGGAVLFLNTGQRLIFNPIGLVLINSSFAVILSVWLLVLLLDYLRPRLWALIYRGTERVVDSVAVVVIILACVWLYDGVRHVQRDAYHFTVNGVRLWTFNKQMGEGLSDFSMRAARIMGIDRTALIYPYSPILYTLLDLNSPAKYDVLIKVGNDRGTPDSVLLDVIRRLKDIPVKFIITYDWGPNVFQTVSRSLGMGYVPNVLDNFIIEHYRPVLMIDGFMLMRLQQ